MTQTKVQQAFFVDPNTRRAATPGMHNTHATTIIIIVTTAELILQKKV